MIIFYCKVCKIFIYYTDIIIDKKSKKECCPKCYNEVKQAEDYDII